MQQVVGLQSEEAVFPGKRYLDWELPDPAGKTPEEVRPIRDEIDRRAGSCWTNSSGRPLKPVDARRGRRADSPDRTRRKVVTHFAPRLNPVFIPHDIEDRGVTTGTDKEHNAHVTGAIRVLPQVTEYARPTLSRWRHGFKSRWDYKREPAGQRHGYSCGGLVEQRLKHPLSRKRPARGRA
jgi:hypothetical protein